MPEEEIPYQVAGQELYTQGEGAKRARDLYVQDLGMDKWRQVVLEPSYALSQDVTTWLKIQRDTVFAFAIQTRRRLVSSPSFMVEPASQDPIDVQAATIVEQLLKQIQRFWSGRYNLTDADFRGSAYALIKGGRKLWRPSLGKVTDGTFKRGKLGIWYVIDRLVDVDRYRFQVANIDNRRVIQFRSIERDVWEELLYPELFVRHIYEDAEDAKGYGRGLLDSLYFIWYTKMTCLEFGLKAVEAFANGRVDVEIDGLRQASPGKDNDAIAQQWRDAVKGWLQDNVLTHDSKDKVNQLDAPSTGHEMVMNFIKYCDSAFTRLCLGSEAPYGAAEGNKGLGAGKAAEEGGDTSDDYLEPSRDLLAESLTTSVVKLLWDQNRPNLYELGLGEATMPKLKLRRHPVTDPKKEAETIKILKDAGVDQDLADIYERTQRPNPLPGSAILAGSTAPAFPPGLGLGGPPGGGDGHPFGTDGQGGDSGPGKAEGPDQDQQKDKPAGINGTGNEG